jgi:hypothetical protein
MAPSIAQETQQLRAKAAQCRRLAASIVDRREAELLIEMARQCEERARQLEPLVRVATHRDV